MYNYKKLVLNEYKKKIYFQKGVQCYNLHKIKIKAGKNNIFIKKKRNKTLNVAIRS